jgi:hypothetical protein
MLASVKYCGRGIISFDWEISNILHVSTTAADDVGWILGALSVLSIYSPLISQDSYLILSSHKDYSIHSTNKNQVNLFLTDHHLTENSYRLASKSLRFALFRHLHGIFMPGFTIGLVLLQFGTDIPS